MRRSFAIAAVIMAASCSLGDGPFGAGSGQRKARVDGAEPPAADTTPPDTLIVSAPPALSNFDPVLFALEADEPGSTFECALDALPFAPCSATPALSSVGEGQHDLRARAIDAAGNVDLTPATATFRIDRTPPSGTLAITPAAVANQASAVFSQTANEATTWECALDAQPLAPCPSTVTLLALGNGSHTFTSLARDLAGNVDPTPTSYGWVVDTLEPDTALMTIPTPLSTSTTATFTLWSNDSPVTYECRLDGAPFAACGVTATVSSLADGAHTFEARAIDMAGNRDQSPITFSWRVDTVGPAVHFRSTPASPSASATAYFDFAADEAPVTFTCSLDGAAFGPCTPPVVSTGLTEATHTFRVRATDVLGNLSTATASASVLIDLTPPNTSFSAAPLNGSLPPSTFVFTATESATFECNLDGAGYSPCTSPVTVHGLASGGHTFAARATDAAGNVDASPASHGWNVGGAVAAGGWVLRTAQGFSSHPSAWDGTSNRVAAFGGGTPNALWHWDGTTWTQAPGATPPSRVNSAMVWDAARSRLVLFGGFGATGNDTWEWDGVVWVQRTFALTPPARNMPAMAYDEARGRVVLFGGYGLNDFADTWEYDGTAWTQRLVAGPPGRHNHAMAYDRVRSRVVLFAGESYSTGYLRDTWEWDGVTWTQRANNGPQERFSHAMAWDGNRGRVVMFGGFSMGNLNDTWEWNGASWTQRGVSGPSSRREHGLAWDPLRNRVVLSGGYASQDLEDTWEWDGNTWSLRVTPPPPRRMSHGMTFDSSRNVTVVFGGVDVNTASIELSDTWEWSGSGWANRITASGPTARRHHAMAFDAARGVTVLFGGQSGFTYRGDTWTWNGTAWQSMSGAAPSPRHSHALAFDPLRQRVVLFGGRDGYGIFDQTWEWDGAAWTQRTPTTAPPPRFNHVLAWDPSRQRIVAHGGIGYRGVVFDDTWEYDGTTWTRAATNGPPAYDAAMTWDGTRLLLYGGKAPPFTQYDHGWVWSGTQWTATTETGPGARFDHVMVWDSARSRVVLFGYDTSGVVSQTWEHL